MVEDCVCVVSKHETPRNLNQWADSLREPEIDFLLAEAHRVLASQQQNFSAVDSRVVAIVGWAIVGIGTLLIAGNVDFDSSARGLSAILVIVGASIAVGSGVFALWPRVWASGMDPAWYSSYEWQGLKEMKARGLAALMHGAELNGQVLSVRTRAFQMAATGLVLEFAALAGTLLLP